jgi:hypothetical protein
MDTLVQNYTYGVNKKILTVHSVDRDLSKYPNANEFDIELPVEYKNVVAMRLNDITMPNVNNYSLANQNTKITIGPSVLEIAEGFYPDAAVMAGELNAQIAVDPLLTGANVVYDGIRRKFIFVYTSAFTIDFRLPEVYPDCGDSYHTKSINWGLGSYLGFNKKVYDSLDALTNPIVVNFAPLPTNSHYILADNIANVPGDRMVYMECALYNSMDELEPYANRSTDNMPYRIQKINHVKFGGKHNAAFAKIPVGSYSSHLTVPYSIFMSDPPLERLQRLRFKFRYHDGRLVDFNDLDFSFTIEITLLRSEMPKFQTVNSSNFRL